MTDKELLEAAARAAGLPEIAWTSGAWTFGEKSECRTGSGDVWNPLTDDGDCARMEAVLETEIQWHEYGVQAGKRSNPISAFCFYADRGGDKNATRRAASVTFAAEVGSSHNAGNKRCEASD